MQLMSRFWITLLFALALFAGWCATAVVAATGDSTSQQPKDAPAAEERGDGFLRVVDDPSKSISLEIASQTFVHEDEDKPTIALVAVAHIADASFYTAVEEILEAYELVLYEAVAPAGVRSASGETREQQIETTHSAMMFVASLIEQFRVERGRYPRDIDELHEHMAKQEPIVRNWFHHAVIDPWGQRLVYKRVNDETGQDYELFSNGPADAVSDDAAAVRFDRHAEVQPFEMDEMNLQKQLASAIDLAYQLESLPYESPNWRISDMTAEDLYRAFSGSDADFEMVAGTLTGSSLPARLIGMLLSVIRTLDAMTEGVISDTVKVLFIEILGDEDLIKMGMAQMGKDFTSILIDQRNQTVIDDLSEVISNEPDVKSIAVLYGAAHMRDLVERLEDQLGYTAHESTWLPAITVDLESSRVDRRQLMSMRAMVRQMMRSPMMQRR